MSRGPDADSCKPSEFSEDVDATVDQDTLMDAELSADMEGEPVLNATEPACCEDDAAPEAVAEMDPVALLTQQLEVAAEKYLRLRADLDNFRKRKSKEIDEVRRTSKIATLEEVLPVMDQFQMAVNALESSADIETMKQGMGMILNTFRRCFENLGVEQVKTVGEAFDPNVHEAITTEPSDEVAPEHIIREWKSGYCLGKHLLRPAVVVISSGPADLTTPASETITATSEDTDTGADEAGTET